MKSFKDIEFKPHSFGEGVHGLLFFPNGYGVSVVRYKNPISKSFGSYTSNDSEWEVAVLCGNEKGWEITYDTYITNDVIGHLSEGGVEWIIILVQDL
jgi:hypothetical protein